MELFQNERALLKGTEGLMVVSGKPGKDKHIIRFASIRIYVHFEESHLKRIMERAEVRKTCLRWL